MPKLVSSVTGQGTRLSLYQHAWGVPEGAREELYVGRRTICSSSSKLVQRMIAADVGVGPMWSSLEGKAWPASSAVRAAAMENVGSVRAIAVAAG